MRVDKPLLIPTSRFSHLYERRGNLLPLDQLTHIASDEKAYSRDHEPSNWSSNILHKKTFPKPKGIKDTIYQLITNGIKVNISTESVQVDPTTFKPIKLLFAQPPNYRGKVSVFAQGVEGNISLQTKAAIDSYKAGQAFCIACPQDKTNPVHAAIAAKKFLQEKKQFNPNDISFKEAFIYGSNNVDAALNYLDKEGIQAKNFKLGFRTEDGSLRTVQIIYAQPPASLHNGQVDLFAHGRLCDISSQVDSAIQSYKEGKAFCLTSYRGMDGNPGVASQDSNADAIDAAVEFLLKERDFKSKDINFTGASMGSESIINMLQRRRNVFGKSGEEFGKLKLISPYLSLQDITKHSIARFSILRNKETTIPKPTLWLLRDLLMWTFKDPIFSLKDNVGILPQTVSSVEIYASKDDQFIPFDHTYKLFERIKHAFNEPISASTDKMKQADKRVRLYAFEGLTHNQMAAKVISETKFPVAYGPATQKS